MKITEKRKYVRIERQFTANISIQSGPNIREWSLINIENLSAGGMLFRYENNIPAGAKIKIRITFPPSESPVFAAGKIVRVEETGDIPKYKIGVEFIDIKELHKNIIEQAVKEIYS